jgi:putative ABC transport system substrate-binding protein
MFEALILSRLSKILRFIAFFYLILFWSSSYATVPASITIVISAPSALSHDFVDQFKAELKPYIANGLRVNVSQLADLPKLRIPDNQSHLLIAVGVQAFNELSKLETKLPIFGVFVPQLSYEAIWAESKRNQHKFSAILLDQPVERQIALLRIMLPAAERIGVLYGPSSRQFGGALQQSAREHGLELIEKELDQSADLMPKLKQVLENSQVLLAIPDPSVYSRETAQTILLTSYRYQKPVIGFSQAYVRAGALAAIYSSPSQIARQTAEIILQSQDGFPAPRFPKYFSVDINHQVARSLSIDLSDGNALTEEIIRTERQFP